MYFFNRRPRGFHYTYRFTNERRDILDELRRGTSPELLARRPMDKAAEDNGGKRRRRTVFPLHLLFIIALILLLAVVLVATFQSP